MKQWLKEFVHNSLIHPILPFIPKKMANKLHEYNANWTFNDRIG